MLKGYVQSLLDIVYPQCCLGCNKTLKYNDGVDRLICFTCWSEIKKNIPPFCHKCGRHSEDNLCPACKKRIFYFDRAFSPCVYDGLIKELIHKFKYSQQDHLSKILSCLMIEFIKEFNLPPLEYFDMFMPIPLHKSKLREREFNQAELLARMLSSEFKLDLSTNNLWRKKETATQTDLNIDARWLNVKDSFALHEADKVKGKMIILVDDVLTTGATCSEAARILKDNGAKVVFVLTVAN